MNIVEEFREDIHKAINKFVQSYSSFDQIGKERRRNIRKVQYILQKVQDPIQLRQALEYYVERIQHPIFYFLGCLESTRLHNHLKTVLDQDKYQTVAILTRIIKEKDQQLLKVRDNYPSELQILGKVNDLERRWNTQEEKTHSLELEIRLIKKENLFLYQDIANLHSENERLKHENNELKVELRKYTDPVPPQNNFTSNPAKLTL